MLDKFSKEKVPPGVAIGIPGEYFNLGSENGRWIDGTVDLAKFLVQQGSAVVKGSVANWNHVAITLSAQEREEI